LKIKNLYILTVHNDNAEGTVIALITISDNMHASVVEKNLGKEGDMHAIPNIQVFLIKDN